MNNALVNFNTKLNNALIQTNVNNLLSDVEKQLLANTYVNLFNSFYGINNFYAQTAYVYDIRFWNYINQYIFSSFYNQMIKELNSKVLEIRNRIGNVILYVNRYLYNR